MTTADPPAGNRRPPWIFLGCAVAFAVTTALALYYVSSSHVPRQLMRLVEVDAPYSSAAAASFWIANWVVRLLPVLVFGLPIFGLVVAGGLALALLRWPTRPVLRGVALLILSLGLGQLVASAFIVYSLHAAYAAADPGKKAG